MKTTSLIAALVLWTSAATAQATCPTQSDLAQGITLTRVVPFYSNVMTRIDGGLSEARIMVRDGVQEDVSTTYAHALAATERVGANGTIALVYAGDTFEMDQLRSLGTWSSDVTLLSDGVPGATGIFRATFISATQFTIGQCSFDTWQVRTVLDLNGSPQLLQDRYYAPALGIALGTVSLDTQGDPVGSVIYDEIEIR